MGSRHGVAIRETDGVARGDGALFDTGSIRADEVFGTASIGDGTGRWGGN